MRRWMSPSAARHARLRVLLVLWLVCAPLAWFFVQLAQDVPLRQARVVAAAFDWHGERGTVTVSHSEEVREGGGRGGSTRRTYCYGTFTPDDGSAPLSGIRVHVGSCEEGREVAARLVPKDGSWLIPNESDQAYAGHGWGEPLVLMLFMGLFTLLVGTPFVLFAVVMPVTMVQVLYHRARDRG